MICIPKIEALIAGGNEYWFHHNYLNLQTRVSIFSRIIGELHQCITPGTILENITTERKEEFGTEKAVNKNVKPGEI